MKKITALLISFLFIFTLSAEENFFTISVGLSSGVPFYGSEDLSDKIKSFEDKNNRSIIGVNGTLNLNVSEPITFFFGTDFISDFNWLGNTKLNVFTFDLSTGIKVYPNLEGFNIGIAYCLGYRTDYFGNANLDRTASPWGNGYKISMEYNFHHENNTRFLPSIGISWKKMPRGNKKYDNFITAYCLLNI